MFRLWLEIFWVPNPRLFVLMSFPNRNKTQLYSKLTWNVWWFVNEYITIKPCPFLIYKSLIDANCSVPAVSKISNTQGELSTCNSNEKWKLWKWKNLVWIRIEKRCTYLYLFPIEILYSWIIFLNKAAGHKLNCECWFSHSTGPQNNDLKLTHYRM